MSRADLAKASGISYATIRKVESSDIPVRTIHEDAAAALACTLGLKVEEIAWPATLSNIGRPPKTGKKFQITEREQANCPKCFTALPVSGICDYCN